MATPETIILESGEELSGDSRRLRVSERAYQIWLDHGCPANSAESDWLEAERQIEDKEANRSSWSRGR